MMKKRVTGDWAVSDEAAAASRRAHRIADHVEPGTTKLYDRTARVVERAEIERIRI